MTAQEFDSVQWQKGIKVKYDRRIYQVIAVNFLTRKIMLMSFYGNPTVSHLKCELVKEE